MRFGRKLFAGIFLAALAAGATATQSLARDRWSRANEGRAHGPTALGPWVGGPWDNEWAEKLPYGHTPWGAPIFPVVSEWYPWGYAAPFVRVDRRCVANDVNVSLGGDFVRYQRVRPGYYCSGE